MKNKFKHTVKYRFSCLAPSELTEFNVEWNKEIEDQCNQEHKFVPHPSCGKCPYLKIKGYS